MRFAFRILIFASLASMGMGSCSTGVEEACRDQLPAFNEQSSRIRGELAQFAPSTDTNRAIASVSPNTGDTGDAAQDRSKHLNRVFDLPLERKTQWQDWSGARLKEMERYIDYVRTRAQYRPALAPLSELANELVRFDGYVDQGKAFQAIAALERAQMDLDAVAKATCTPSTAPASGR